MWQRLASKKQTIKTTKGEWLIMSLKDMASQILADGFDPKTSPVSDFENLPDGEYDAILENVEWRVSQDGGFEWLSLAFEILNDGFEGRKHFGMISFANERMVGLNIKRAMKTASAVGVELDPEVFEEPETALVEAFEDGLGTEVALTLSSYVSKKTGKTGQNFDVEPATPFV